MRTIGLMVSETVSVALSDHATNFMKSLFIPSRGLNSLIDEWLNPCLDDTNWLFVNLDSAYGDYLSNKRKFLGLQLQEQQIDFWWEDEGLWLPGKELIKDFLIYKVIVTFSAAFIFPSEVKRSASPQFSDTTDQGEFTSLQLSAVGQEICRMNAKGYVADGCGLQCVLADEDLFRMITAQRDSE
jgi:hypothetical protein